jgi:hypothetical protein
MSSQSGLRLVLPGDQPALWEPLLPVEVLQLPDELVRTRLRTST